MAYCQLCDRGFSSELALRKHLHNAFRHAYDCRRCDRHYKSASAREQHFRDSPRHNLCHKCCYPEDFCTEVDLIEHEVEEHNRCEVCWQYFSSPSNLKNHLITHAPKDTECPGCYRTFVSTSAMVLHLERATCASGADIDTVYDATDATPGFSEYRSHDSYFPFHCISCGTFRFMSGLLQHVESDACHERLGRLGPLDEFLDELVWVVEKDYPHYP